MPFIFTLIRWRWTLGNLVCTSIWKRCDGNLSYWLVLTQFLEITSEESSWCDVKLSKITMTKIFSKIIGLRKSFNEFMCKYCATNRRLIPSDNLPRYVWHYVVVETHICVAEDTSNRCRVPLTFWTHTHNNWPWRMIWGGTGGSKKMETDTLGFAILFKVWVQNSG